MENISGTLEGGAGGELTKVRPVQNILIVAINSNRGLCGAFNANIIRTVNRLVREDYAAQAKEGNVKILCIGKKASDFFSKSKNLYAGNHNELYAKLTFDNVAVVADSIMKEFASGKYDRVDIIYNQFKNAAVQYVQHEKMLPVSPPVKTGNEKAVVHDYIFEPGKEELVLELLPKSVRIQLFKALLDSHASEHGARMTAMSKATDNAGDLLRELRLSYNKARQAAITGEILEIVAGAEALNG
ncbi:MAG TPA: ATP synthase F1 subunit gamma, partial [Bacteroidia bacterium]|nr:ATP synthase F1 subunit gamma [Bacteroidia bacterium]